MQDQSTVIVTENKLKRLQSLNAELVAALEAITEPMTWKDVRFQETSMATEDRGYLGFNIPGERLFRGHADKWWDAMRTGHKLVCRRLSKI